MCCNLVVSTNPHWPRFSNIYKALAETPHIANVSVSLHDPEGDDISSTDGVLFEGLPLGASNHILWMRPWASDESCCGSTARFWKECPVSCTFFMTVPSHGQNASVNTWNKTTKKTNRNQKQQLSGKKEKQQKAQSATAWSEDDYAKLVELHMLLTKALNAARRPHISHQWKAWICIFVCGLSISLTCLRLVYAQATCETRCNETLILNCRGGVGMTEIV